MRESILKMLEFQSNVICKEMDESFSHLERQHSHIIWFIQVYMAVFSGYAVLCGYFGSKDGVSIVQSVVGLIGSVLVFMLGWVILTVVANKITSIYLIHKHMANLRRERRVKLDLGFGDNYVFHTDASTFQLPRSIEYVPYVIFLVNYSVIFGGIIFNTYKLFTFPGSLMFALAIGAAIGLKYPDVCVSFNKQLWAAATAKSFVQESALEDWWDNRRKEAKKKIDFFPIALVLFLISIFPLSPYVHNSPFGLLVLSSFPYINSPHLMLVVSVITSYIFVNYRYRSEVKFNRFAKKTSVHERVQ